MTLYQLHNMLGEELEKVKDSDKLSEEEQKKILDSATVFSSLSKQMINNADVVLRIQKFAYENNIPSNSDISRMVSNSKNPVIAEHY